jgi:FKBP-type peptidyl-prolyl cis-trans isomerase FklB
MNIMKIGHLLGIIPGLLAPYALAEEASDLSRPTQALSYALGMDLAGSFKWDGLEVDLKALAAGLEDMQAGRPALTSAQRGEVLKAMQDDLTARAEAKKKVAGEKNLQRGKAFLEANAKKEGVRILEATAHDGSKAELQYEVIKAGEGPRPGRENVLTVHYVGTLLDGTVFDSSVERNEPFTGRAHDFIAGWTEPLLRMRAGEKWRLFIPPGLGYGEFVPYNIGPYSTLIYEIELLAIGPPETVAE